MKPDLVVERVYNHPVWRVWGAVTEPQSMKRWLGPTNFLPSVGHVFVVNVPTAPGFDGEVVGEVIEVEAPTRLRMFWRGGPVESHVCIELEEDGDSTRLRLTQSGFDKPGQGALASVLLPFWGRALGEGLPAQLQPQAVPNGGGVAKWLLLGGTTATALLGTTLVGTLWLGGLDVPRMQIPEPATASDYTPPDRVTPEVKTEEPPPPPPVNVRSDGAKRTYDLPTYASSSSSGASGASGSHTMREIRYYEETLPTTMNPLFARSSVDHRTHTLLFDRLYSRSSITNELVSRLVVEDTVDEPGRALAITLRDGIHWHDGAPLTAADVCFTVQAMLDPATPSTIDRSYTDALLGCEVHDTHRLTLRFVHAFPYLRERAGFLVLPRHAFDGKTAISPTHPFSTYPVGTGPYSTTRGRRSIQFNAVANAHHNARVPSFRLQEGGDPFVQVRTLLQNGVDGLVNVRPALRPEVAASTHSALKSYDLRAWWFVAVNTHRGPLADVRVRQALDLMLDRDELRMLTIGVDPQDHNPPCELISGPFVQSSPYYNRRIRVNEQRDLAGADKLLTAAGVTRVAGALVLHGKPLMVRIGMRADLDMEAHDLLNQINNQLTSAGLKTELYKIPTDDWAKLVVTGGSTDHFDLLIGKWTFAGVEDVSPLFHTRADGKGDLNIFNYSDPDVDRLVDAHAAATTATEARDAYHDLHATIAKKKPYLFLWTLDTKSAWNHDVQSNIISPYTYFQDVDGWRH